MNENSNIILVLFAHPAIHHSTINQFLIKRISAIEGVIVNDLYENYPEFYIDVERERQLLQKASLIIFQHPFYWFNCPPLLKLWQDVVLEKGFAYGEHGTALQGKDFLQVISTGAKALSYRADNKYRFSMNELLRPFMASAHLCGMNYRPPVVLHSSSYQSREKLEQHATQYAELLSAYLQKGSTVFDDSLTETIVTP